MDDAHPKRRSSLIFPLALKVRGGEMKSGRKASLPRKKASDESAIAGAIGGAVIGALLGGPAGAIVGGFIGLFVGAAAEER